MNVPEEQVFKLNSPDKIGPLPERKKVEVKIWDAPPPMKYSIRAWELRGRGMICLPEGERVSRWERIYWWMRGGRFRGRTFIMPMTWGDRWFNFKAHCSMIRFRITDKLGVTKP